MALSDLLLKNSYRTGRDNLLYDFYLPCMSEASEYRRAVGFFSSDALGVAATGMNRLIRRRGRVRLVASPHLSASDIESIKKGYKTREELIERALVQSLESPMPQPMRERLGFVAWLIAEGLLDIKIAIVETGNGFGLYHEKLGIFSDEDDNHVVFSGSANESVGGLISNFESTDVFCSWIHRDIDRAQEKISDFEALWANATPNLAVYDFPEAARRELLRFRPNRHPQRDPEEVTMTLGEQTSPLDAPGIPADMSLRPYQVAALHAWFHNNGSGIWKMATGTGKTVTALGLIIQLFRLVISRNAPLVVIILCPYQHLVTQWAAAAKSFKIEPILCYRSRNLWHDDLNSFISAANARQVPLITAIATYSTFNTTAFQDTLRRITAPLLIVADEVHNAGSDRTRSSLPKFADYRLGLSATPERWYDDEGTSELFNYFGDVVYELGLAEALKLGALTPYTYTPHIVELDEEEAAEYLQLTVRIGRRTGVGVDEITDSTDDEILKQLLLKRARLLASASGKIPLLREVMATFRDTSHNLIYCGDGRVEYSAQPEDLRQLDAVVHLLGSELRMKVNSYTAETGLDNRSDLRARFASGQLQALVAIRCLDEGIDIPETRRAIILASSTNPRQFVQRRGRVLRLAPGKTNADIHDFIVVPPSNAIDEPFVFNTERRLLRRELERVVEFATLATNGPQALHVLLPLRKRYNLMHLG